MPFSRSTRSDDEIVNGRAASVIVFLVELEKVVRSGHLKGNLRVLSSVYSDLNFRYVSISTVEIGVHINLTVDRRGFHFMFRDKLHHLIVRKGNLIPTTFVNQGNAFKRLSPLKMKFAIITRQDFSDGQCDLQSK